MDLTVISGMLIISIQPLDVSTDKLFKESVRRYCKSTWMIEGKKTFKKESVSHTSLMVMYE